MADEAPFDIESRLRATIGQLTEVNFLRGPVGDPWAATVPDASPDFGWTATHIDVGREFDYLYVDTDEGMRYYLPEDREIYIGPPRIPWKKVFDAVFEEAEASPIAALPFGTFTTAEAQAIFGDDLPEPEPDSRPVDDPLYRFLGGAAGTGKTWQVREESRRYDDVILCATSGIAAVNLGGTTINSLLWYFDIASLRTAYELGKLHAALRKIAGSRYRRIAIDEMSMMPSDQLDIICMALDEVNNGLIKAGDRPIGLTLLGDMCQLPPIGWGEKKYDHRKQLLPPVKFCFEADCWPRFAEHITLLTKPMRQADPTFIAALSAVRRGDALEAMEYFRDKLHATEDPNFDGTTVLAKNDEVDRYNKLRMMDLSTDEVYFPATKTGEQLGEWKHVPDRLVVKEGALVMCLTNYRAGGEIVYANGDLAYFIDSRMAVVTVYDDRGRPRESNERCAHVRLKRNDREVDIPYVKREKKVATGNAGVKAPRDEVKGSIKYMPLRVAYATTVHKAQGLTLDNVQLMFQNHFWTHPSMLYVGLSRARTMEGLRLVGTLSQFVKRCKTNPAVAQWL